jgi:AcrR family transcriptional regulator
VVAAADVLMRWGATLVPAPRDSLVMLGRHGRPGLSTRRLAHDLGVQPGAPHYHIATKQDLLAAVAERILTDRVRTISSTGPVEAAPGIRQALQQPIPHRRQQGSQARKYARRS